MSITAEQQELLRQIDDKLQKLIAGSGAGGVDNSKCVTAFRKCIAKLQEVSSNASMSGDNKFDAVWEAFAAGLNDL